MPTQNPITDHRRQWLDFRYVYPVISRRSRGLSVGVNLNIDKSCNFSCRYCQINRRLPREPLAVDLDVLEAELQAVLTSALDGSIWQADRFRETPENLRRINDIAFSGDGEPTAVEHFDIALAAACRAKNALGLDAVQIVIITNATRLASESFGRALNLLRENNGRIWAKLDAGSDAYFQRVNRPHPRVTLEEICDNITRIAKQYPVIIQTLMMTIDSQPPSEFEIAAYIGQLQTILAAGGQISAVHLHSIARPPAMADVAVLANELLDRIAEAVREKTGLPVETFYGTPTPPQE